MVDALKKRIDAVKLFSESAKRRAGLYSQLAKVDNKNATKSLNALQKAPAPGKKLQKIGFIMFWVPEPSGITCAIGAPMILAGKYLDRVYNGSTIHDIGHHTSETISSIKDFKKSIF